MSALETVEAIYAAFGRGDAGFIIGLVAPGASWRHPATVPWGGNFIGPEGAGDFFTRLNTHFETTGFQIRENIVAGERVISLGRYEGNSRKTGKFAGGDFCFIWQIRDGKIAAYEAHLDSAAYVAALN